MIRQGILVAGNWIIDKVKLIDVYPEEEKLVNISSEHNSNGGSAYNVLMALVKLGSSFPLSALGLVGADPRGEQIVEHCRRLQIDTRQLRTMPGAHTSYTDVMTVAGTGKRTFFHQRGANAQLDIEHFNFEVSNARIFHLGYLLLLDQLDKIEENGVTRASKVFEAARSKGFVTSADIVSERSDRFRSVVPSALPHIDYLFVNEFEACKITGIQTTDESGQAIKAQCFQAAEKIIGMGVKQWVLLHFPEGVTAVSASGEKLFQPSVNLPASQIAGAVGAGDAFAAGVLMGVHEGSPMEHCLKLGVCAAASSLFHATSSDGIISKEECLKLPAKYGLRD
ncbi:carbohydrate kinase family protein [Pedobacter deserti]|uniref:carbohydrate kinase family protein n=1 Tax=Pedobacter deserti TaxID=2817382 RepID=UPI002108DAB4|nr:carbohydrate kinase family protein [Pedobacter sp. SYSU D00382]